MAELKTEYKHIRFVEVAQKPKTKVWECLNNKSCLRVGVVKWYGPWRRYCFFPEPESWFDVSCMDDINDFIKQVRR